MGCGVHVNVGVGVLEGVKVTVGVDVGTGVPVAVGTRVFVGLVVGVRRGVAVGAGRSCSPSCRVGPLLATAACRLSARSRSQQTLTERPGRLQFS